MARVKLFIGQRYDQNPDSPLQNVANVASNILEFRAPQNARWILEGSIEPKIKLFQSGGTEIPRDALVYIAAKRDGAGTVRQIREFGYGPYEQLPITDQRNPDYRESIRQDLGVDRLVITEGNLLIVQLEASVQVDLSETGTTFELEVREVLESN